MRRASAPPAGAEGWVRLVRDLASDHSGRGGSLRFALSSSGWQWVWGELGFYCRTKQSSLSSKGLEFLSSESQVL